MLRAFVEVDRATMGPELLAAKIDAYARLRRYAPGPHRPRSLHQESREEGWRLASPLFPRLLFVLDGTGPAGIENRSNALHTAAADLTSTGFLRAVPVLVASLVDLLLDGP